MKYFLIEGEQLKSEDGREWFHGGLDFKYFKQVVYSIDFTKCVIKTDQEEIPEGLNKITEAKFDKLKSEWDEKKALQEQQQRDKENSSLEILAQSVLELSMLLAEMQGGVE